jgi:hypothetical protein
MSRRGLEGELRQRYEQTAPRALVRLVSGRRFGGGWGARAFSGSLELSVVFSPAIGGVLCALAIRLEYERVNPVPTGSDPATIPYWQLPSGTPVARARLQTFLQMHMKAQGAPEKLYKSHSLRKGGVTALLAAGVPLPQIQLMARWVSPNMAELYASLTTQRLDSAFSCLGVMSSLDVVSEESRFWTAYTARPG